MLPFLAIAMVLAASGDTIALLPRTVDHTVTNPADALASFSLNSNGNASVGPAWCVPAANAALYECNVALTGTVTSGTTGSWLSLGTTRTWTKGQTVVGTASCVLTISIRRIADGAMMIGSGGVFGPAAAITLTATVEA